MLSGQESSNTPLYEYSYHSQLSNRGALMLWAYDIKHLPVLYKLIFLLVFDYEALLVHFLLVTHHKGHIVVNHDGLENWHWNDLHEIIHTFVLLRTLSLQSDLKSSLASFDFLYEPLNEI